MASTVMRSTTARKIFLCIAFKRPCFMHIVSKRSVGCVASRGNSMFGRKLFIAGALLVAGASVSLACGPFFSWQLLDDRAATLRSTPKNSFAYEVQHFVRSTDRLKAVEASYYDTDADR